MQNERDEEIVQIDDKLPLLPLRDVVLFPHITVPLLVGRVASVNAIEEAVAGNRILFATAQKRPDVVDPQKEDLYRLGTVVRVLQLFRLPDGTMRVLVEGLHRARVRRFLSADDYVMARVEMIGEEPAAGTISRISCFTGTLTRSCAATAWATAEGSVRFVTVPSTSSGMRRFRRT